MLTPAELGALVVEVTEYISDNNKMIFNDDDFRRLEYKAQMRTGSVDMCWPRNRIRDRCAAYDAWFRSAGKENG